MLKTADSDLPAETSHIFRQLLVPTVVGMLSIVILNLPGRSRGAPKKHEHDAQE